MKKKATKSKTAAGKPKGSGANFAAVERNARKSGARNPAAVAAKAGIDKYGQKAMTRMAQNGKKRAAAKRKGK